MKTPDEAMQTLLRRTLPKTADAAAPHRDLWPLLQARLEQQSAPPWLDWALGAAVLLAFALCPTALPVLLYYL